MLPTLQVSWCESIAWIGLRAVVTTNSQKTPKPNSYTSNVNIPQEDRRLVKWTPYDAPTCFDRDFWDCCMRISNNRDWTHFYLGRCPSMWTILVHSCSWCRLVGFFHLIFLFLLFVLSFVSVFLLWLCIFLFSSFVYFFFLVLSS